jgi:drug/metabolite transporter (DMT)-like permease
MIYPKMSWPGWSVLLWEGGGPDERGIMTAAFRTRTAKVGLTAGSVVLICMASLIWALMEIIVQHIPGRYPIYQIVWVRYGVHLLFMLAVFGRAQGKKLLSTNRLGLQILRALMMLVMPISFIVATNTMSVSNIVSLFWLAPLLIIVFSRVLLGESVSWASWGLAVAGWVVVIALVGPNQNISGSGVLLALAAAVSFSLYVVMTKMLQGESVLTNLFYTALGVFIPLSLAVASFWQPLTLRAAFMMSSLGLLGFLLLWMLDKALDAASPSALAPFLFTQTFFMIALEFLL